jgi:hypothetical protein
MYGCQTGTKCPILHAKQDPSVSNWFQCLGVEPCLVHIPPTLPPQHCEQLRMLDPQDLANQEKRGPKIRLKAGRGAEHPTPQHPVGVGGMAIWCR